MTAGKAMTITTSAFKSVTPYKPSQRLTQYGVDVIMHSAWYLAYHSLLGVRPFSKPPSANFNLDAYLTECCSFASKTRPKDYIIKCVEKQIEQYNATDLKTQKLRKDVDILCKFTNYVRNVNDESLIYADLLKYSHFGSNAPLLPVVGALNKNNVNFNDLWADYAFLDEIGLSLYRDDVEENVMHEELNRLCVAYSIEIGNVITSLSLSTLEPGVRNYFLENCVQCYNDAIKSAIVDYKKRRSYIDEIRAFHDAADKTLHVQSLFNKARIEFEKKAEELARKEKDNAGKKEETLMSNEQTKQPVTDKPAKKTMTDKLREDIEDAAWRSAARSSTKVVAEPLAALIAAKIDPDDSRMKEALIKFSESEYGKAFVAAAISMLLEAAPVKDKHAERAARFASELRKLAFEMSFTATADLALDPMMIVLRNFIMGKNVDLFENLMKELPESSILLDDVQTEESESKVDVKENVKLAQVSSEHERDPALGPF